MSILLYHKYLILLFLPLFFIFANSQLTTQDKNIIENYITSGQSEKTGLFFEEESSLKHTKEAISSLNILGLQTKYSQEICKNISEKKSINVNLVTIDKLLKCEIDFKSYKPDFNKKNLVDLYNEGQIMDILKNDEWEGLFKKLKNYMASENGKFSLTKISENKKKSLLATALGIEIMELIAEKKPDLKEEIIPILQKSINSLIKSYSILNDDMIVYIEKNIPNYKLNYHIIKALKLAKKAGAEVPSLSNMLYKLLNYFNTFKYEVITNIDNTFYLLNIYKLLEKIRLIVIHKESYNFSVEKSLKMNFENIFGEKVNIKNSIISIDISVNTNKNSKLASKKKSQTDSEQEEYVNTYIRDNKKEIKIDSPTNEVNIDLRKTIREPGYFTFDIKMENHVYDLNEHTIKTIRCYSELEIESINFEIIDKIHDEYSQHFSSLKYPSKYKEEIKANQDCSLIARVRISCSGKAYLMEQTFLRLRNKELNKSYNAYTTKYDPDEDEYFIGFELDDPANMESYNGVYEMFIIMSDPKVEKVLKWKFGEITISFTKPTDPLNEVKALKNKKIEPKMEPTFTPEINREKNMNIALIFCGIIILLTVLLLLVLVKSESNIKNFPKNSFSFIMNILFIGVLAVVAHILFLFWTKYNILQTMFIFVVMCLPASFIVYKALKNHKIEIVADEDE